MSHSEQNDIAETASLPLRIGDWLWRPGYVKLWWAAVPLYWLGMGFSQRSEVLYLFYSSALAGYLTIFFFPPLVALILCHRFFREWLRKIPQADGEPLFPDEMFLRSDSYGPSGMPWEFDPLDPRSGAHWNGSPLNPINPTYINRAS